jgi:hypothetical protein
MPRASGIWVVISPDLKTDRPSAIFTVKHEMITYLKKVKELRPEFSHFEVLRYQDGRDDPPELFWDLKELLGEE